VAEVEVGEAQGILIMTATTEAVKGAEGNRLLPHSCQAQLGRRFVCITSILL
jgi:hypothetical protein